MTKLVTLEGDNNTTGIIGTIGVILARRIMGRIMRKMGKKLIAKYGKKMAMKIMRKMAMRRAQKMQQTTGWCY